MISHISSALNNWKTRLTIFLIRMLYRIPFGQVTWINDVALLALLFLCDSSTATTKSFLWGKEIRDAHRYRWWEMLSCNVQCWLIKRTMFHPALQAVMLHTISQSILLSNKTQFMSSKRDYIENLFQDQIIYIDFP